MASQASLSSAFNMFFFISFIIFMTKFLPQIDSRPLQKPNDHHIQSDEGKVMNSFRFNKKGKNMKQAVNEMKDLPPFPNIPDMPITPLPPFPFPFPFTFPPPFDIPNIPPFPDFPLPPFPNFPPFPFPPPAA